MSHGPTSNEWDQARAKALKSHEPESQQGAEVLEFFPAVDIDSGVFKYVLIEVWLRKRPDNKRLLVRGRLSASYHADVAEPVIDKLESFGVAHNVLGGGRINHDRNTKQIKVFGHSIGFPWDNGVFRHDLTAKVLSEHFGASYNITTSNEGY